jgi:hypothetical protein
MVASAKDLSAGGQDSSSISGLYAHFIGGRRVLAEGPADLVREAAAAGIGPHEQGRDAVDFFTKVKTVYINYG